MVVDGLSCCSIWIFDFKKQYHRTPGKPISAIKPLGMQGWYWNFTYYQQGYRYSLTYDLIAEERLVQRLFSTSPPAVLTTWLLCFQAVALLYNGHSNCNCQIHSNRTTQVFLVWSMYNIKNIKSENETKQ